MIELLQKRYLPDGSARHTLVLRLQPDSLKRKDGAVLLVFGLQSDRFRAATHAQGVALYTTP